MTQQQISWKSIITWLLPGAIALILLAALLMPRLSGRGDSPADVVAACQRSVQDAKAAADLVVATRATQFSDFIEQRKAGTTAFAKEVVSLYGKWRATKPYLPFTDADGHRRYIEEQFGKYVFSKDELAAELALNIDGGLHDIDAIENNVARQCRMVTVSAPDASPPRPDAPESLDTATRTMQTASQVDVAKSAGSLVASEVAAQIGSQVLVNLGVSSGVLAAGAASSPWTLGAGLLIGLIVDATWEWIDDPAGDIERETRAALDNVAQQGSASLRNELGTVAEERKALWESTAKALE